MKRLLLTIIIIATSVGLYAQNVGIGTNNPDASAKLDITATDGGILIPRINLSTVSFPAPGPATGLLVWNTNGAFGTGIGFYYNTGTAASPTWVRVLDSASSLDDADADPTNENQTVSAGTGISVSQTGQDFEVINTAPDQTVTLTQGGATTITGTYPNFTISSTDNNTTYDGTDFAISNQTCPAGQVARGFTAAGIIICVADDDTDADASTTNELTDLQLSGNTLSLTNPATGGNSVDLSGYLNTDDQKVDAFSLSGSTLNLSLESDGVTNYTVDLSSLDNGDITGVTAGAGLTGG